MKEQEGPVNTLRPAQILRSCSGLDHKLVKSGYNPTYRDDCSHEAAPNFPMKLSFTGNLRSHNDVIEPGDWRPFESVNAIDLV